MSLLTGSDVELELVVLLLTESNWGLELGSLESLLNWELDWELELVSRVPVADWEVEVDSWVVSSFFPPLGLSVSELLYSHD